MDDLEREVERLRGWVRWAAEVTLATMEYEQCRSRPVKREIQRQKNIAHKLLMAQRGGVPDRGARRVDEIERRNACAHCGGQGANYMSSCRCHVCEGCATLRRSCPHAPEGDGR